MDPGDRTGHPLHHRGPRRQVHRRLRRDLHRRGPGDSEDPATGTAGKIATPSDGYAQPGPSAPIGCSATANATCDRSSRSTPATATGTGPTSPASNDHPTMTSKPPPQHTSTAPTSTRRRSAPRAPNACDLINPQVSQHAAGLNRLGSRLSRPCPRSAAVRVLSQRWSSA
jgi:hypothetical protein